MSVWNSCLFGRVRSQLCTQDFADHLFVDIGKTESLNCAVVTQDGAQSPFNASATLQSPDSATRCVEMDRKVWFTGHEQSELCKSFA